VLFIHRLASSSLHLHIHRKRFRFFKFTRQKSISHPFAVFFYHKSSLATKTMPAHRTARTTQRTNATARPRPSTRSADGDISPHPESPQIRTVKDEPVTPGSANTPITAADLQRLEERLLAHLQSTPGAGQQGASSIPSPLSSQGSSAEYGTDTVPQPLRGLGLDAATISDIAHNKFKASNLYQISHCSEYTPSSNAPPNNNDIANEEASFWQAWELYKAVFIATAPLSLRAELAISLAVYTSNLWKLRNNYNAAGMMAYHFDFHRDILESDRYNPDTWRTIDGNRVVLKCIPAYLRTARRAWR
jgi:hypothetical protein